MQRGHVAKLHRSVAVHWIQWWSLYRETANIGCALLAVIVWNQYPESFLICCPVPRVDLRIVLIPARLAVAA